MAIANDWDIDFPNKIISHVDGVLSYDAMVIMCVGPTPVQSEK